MSKFLRILAWTLIIGGAIVGIARLTVIRWWRVPVGDPYLEASLAPTLRGGDLVILWRGTAPIEGNLVLCPEPKGGGRYTIGRILAALDQAFGGQQVDQPDHRWTFEPHFVGEHALTHVLASGAGQDQQRMGRGFGQAMRRQGLVSLAAPDPCQSRNQQAQFGLDMRLGVGHGN